MNDSAVRQLNDFGQSPWLDFISRDLVRSGNLDRLIERWGLGGVTTNPAIFEKAIGHSSDYDADIARMSATGASTADIYEALVLDDVRRAADCFASVYASTGGRNGYVSIEVSPHLVDDSSGTVAEGERLWASLDRPNVMIKVPGTAAGLVAVEDLIAAGINVNVTLLFSLQRYREVTGAFLTGLERASASGRALETIASVASFFLSRIDTVVDGQLEPIVAAGNSLARLARELKGEIAIASATRAYAIQQEVTASQRCRALLRKGGRMQRLLWASTGNKNPEYEDIKYVQPLIAPETVSTLPLETLEAYARHGVPAASLNEDSAAAENTLRKLKHLGIDLQVLTDRLLVEGIEKFIQPFDATYRAIDEKRRAGSVTSSRGESGDQHRRPT